jgi:outer membrane protein insertion porin family
MASRKSIEIITVFLAVLCMLPARAAEAQDQEGRIIDEIRITGARHTREHTIFRELVSRRGEPFNRDNLSEDYANLDALGIFSEIRIYPIEDQGNLVLVIEVTETFRYLPTVAISIDDENGISVGGGLKSINLFGRAISFSGALLVGGATTAELYLKDPWVTGNHIGYELQYYHRDRRNELFDFGEVSDELYLFLSRYLGRKGRIAILGSYFRMRSNKDGKTLDPDNIDNMITCGLLLGRDTRDLKSNPGNGWFNSIDILRFWSLDMDAAFWRGDIDIRGYKRISGPHVLAFFSLTTMSTGTVGIDIPQWQQLSLGGTNSIRGWNIGRRYGKNQFINTLEYRWNILRPARLSFFGISSSLGIQFAVFGDVGAVWTEEKSFSDSFIGGGGVGIRLIVPYVGLARMDFGVGESGLGIHVHLGSREKAERSRYRVR